jgi:hypothetical protein
MGRSQGDSNGTVSTPMLKVMRVIRVIRVISMTVSTPMLRGATSINKRFSVA